MVDGKIRVAEVIGKWVGGGLEQVVYNYTSRMDKDKFQIDFIIDEDSLFIPKEKLKEAGINIIIVPPYQKVLKYQKALIEIFKENKYDIVHSHENTLSAFPLRAAKKAGIKVRIAHSHSTTNSKEKKKNLLKLILRPFAKMYSTHYFACTEHAGRWMFGDKEVDNGNVYIMNNAIDIEKFKYSDEIRRLKRKELGIKDDALVIGHCGRFVEQKNHSFLIDVFNEIHKEREDAVLLLIGQGPVQDEMKEKVKKMGFENSVIFLGQRKDINELYSVMDVFAFPSLYEGLGMVVVEAQVAGCYCVASTEVPKVAKISNSIDFVELGKTAKEWADITLEKINSNINRNRVNVIDDNNGYNIKNELHKLTDKYIELNKVGGKLA